MNDNADAIGRIEENLAAMRITFKRSDIAAWIARYGIDEAGLGCVESLIDSIKERRRLKNTEMLLHTSRIPQKFPKTFANYDFSRFPSSVEKELSVLKTLYFIDEGKNVVFLGDTGMGKTHLACAIGLECCMRGIPAYYIKLQELVDRFDKARKQNSTGKLLDSLSKPQCLILDEIGYCRLDADDTRLFFELVDRRYSKEYGSIVMTSNKMPSSWGDIFTDEDTLYCILDRLFDRVTQVQFSGESFRGRQANRIEASILLEKTNKINVTSPIG